MATSADHDDRDEKDEKAEAAEGEESAEEKDAEPAKAEAAHEEEGAAPAKAKGRDKGGKDAKAAKAKAKADEEEGAADEEEEEEEEAAEEEEEEEAPAPKAAAKRPGAGRGPGAARARKATAQPQGGGSLGKSVLLFFVIVIGLGVGFVVLGQEKPQQAAKPKWKTGDNPEVEITLVHTDRQDLACASTDEIGGKHCAFEAANKPWSKGGGAEDKTIFKPYTTVDNMQFVAAGLWSEPALAPGKLPTVGRFSVKCRLKIEGTLKTLGVRWHEGDPFFNNSEWYAGSVSGCTLAPPG